jgi:hypothetical protein
MIESVVISWNPMENKYLTTILNTNLKGVYVEKSKTIEEVLALLQDMAEKQNET